MAKAIRVGIMGAGWPGLRHAEGYRASGGFQIAAVADLIPSRRKSLAQQFGVAREVADANELLCDQDLDAVSICLPNHLHLPMAVAALKAGKHVLCEMPPALNASEAKKLSAAAERGKRVMMFAAQRRFGAAEQAARQAIAKGYLGTLYHIRVSWMRTRGIPSGTGWFTTPTQSGGGAMMDLGAPMLDLAWTLLGQPRPVSLSAVVSNELMDKPGLSTSATSEGEDAAAREQAGGVESAAFLLARFEGDKSLELSVSWAINQPPRHQGTLCRLHGTLGALDLYTTKGPLLYRKFNEKGEASEQALKLPKTVLYQAMMRQFKECIMQSKSPAPDPAQALTLMQMIDAVYKSAATGKSVQLQ